MITPLTNCLCCGESDLKQVLDLNDQPMANSYPESKTETELVFPLKLNFCRHCTHLQLSDAVDPDLLFKHYIYVSGTSQTLLDYFKWFVTLTEGYAKNKTKNVLDIACNDGSQLDIYKEAGYATYGIDPAENLYASSSRNNRIVCDYLTHDSINSFGVKFDVILAQNVFAHNSYPLEFLELCKEGLAPGGRVYIQTSQANMVQNNEFDTIYHEHLSFFSVKSFVTIARRAGYSVIDVLKTPIHGTSFVFVLSLDEEDGHCEAALKSVADAELNEEVMTNYTNRCYEIVRELKAEISNFKDKGYSVVGYGAAAKGNTLLNFAKIDLDYIVDDNPLKQGLFTPGMRVPIKSPDALASQTGPTLVVPLAWNFFTEIKRKALTKKPDATFIRYFPNIVIE